MNTKLSKVTILRVHRRTEVARIPLPAGGLDSNIIQLADRAVRGANTQFTDPTPPTNPSAPPEAA